MSTSFSWRNPLFTSANRSSVFALDFFHSLFGFGRGGDAGGVDPPADSAASSRDLFFPAAVFMLFDGEGFTLQRQRIFTHILSGAVRGGKQRRHVWIYGLRRGGSVHWLRILGSICFE
jgi:hypothetical protein